MDREQGYHSPGCKLLTSANAFPAYRLFPIASFEFINKTVENLTEFRFPLSTYQPSAEEAIFSRENSWKVQRRNDQRTDLSTLPRPNNFGA